MKDFYKWLGLSSITDAADEYKPGIRYDLSTRSTLPTAEYAFAEKMICNSLVSDQMKRRIYSE